MAEKPKAISFAEEQRQKKSRDYRSGVDSHYGTAIANEMVKAYGFKFNVETEEFDGWSIDNIKEAFKDEPVWSTIDWLTVAVPVGRWGTAATKVALGKGAPALAYQAGKAGKVGKSGKALSFRDAVRITRDTGVPTTKIGRGLKNVVATNMDEYLKVADDYDIALNLGERRHLSKIRQRELKAEQGFIERTGEDLLRDMGKLEPEQSARFSKLLETGGGITRAEKLNVAKKFLKDDELAETFIKTYDFRNYIHEEAYRLDLISKETYERNLRRYNPRLYEEYRKVISNNAQPEGAARLLARTAENHPELTRIWSGELAVNELSKAASLISKHNYAQGLANSPVAQTADDVLGYLAGLDPKKMAMYGVDDAEVLAAKKAMAMPAGRARDRAVNKAVRGAGWQRMNDIGYKKGLPKAMRDKWIDPHVVPEIESVFQIHDANVPGMLESFYKKSLSYFRASKTAYNPATWVRNVFGAMVFHHLSTGSGRAFTGQAMKNGLALYRKGGDSYVEALRAGVIGGSFDKEIHSILKHANIDPKITSPTAVDWLDDIFGKSGFTEYIQKGAGKAERGYRAIDEIAKLDAFDYLRKHRGMSVEQAALEVHKYTPNYMMHSPVADTLRKGIPFSSFATESIRVWGNAFTYKPHLAFMWNHMGDTMSYGVGAMNGYSVEDIDLAKESLPYYQNNKQQLLLPFKVNGKPSFIDLSYLLPMGNIVEMESSNKAFFGQEIIDPTSNPWVGLAASASTNIDPFSGRKLEPRFTERQLGIAVEGESTRKIVGLAEYIARQFTPPLSPNNYAGTNILELIRGDIDPNTMQPLEEGWERTLSANLLGMRSYEASVKSSLKNVQKNTRDLDEQIKQWRDRWKYAKANDDQGLLETAARKIMEFRDERSGDGQEYFEKNSPKWLDPIRGASKEQLRKTQELSKGVEGLGDLTEEDVEYLKAIAEKLKKKRGGRKGRSRKRKSRGR